MRVMASRLTHRLRNKMKAKDLLLWLGAEVANPGSHSRSYCEDERQSERGCAAG